MKIDVPPFFTITDIFTWNLNTYSFAKTKILNFKQKVKRTLFDLHTKNVYEAVVQFPKCCQLIQKFESSQYDLIVIDP